MPQIGNFLVWIDVEDVHLPEYGVTYSADGKQATCWIPSEAGKAFSVCIKDSLRMHTSGTALFVDGSSCGGKIIRPMSTHPHRSSTYIHRGISVSDKAYRPFIFSNCELIEDDSCNPLSIRSEIGDIKVVVDRITASKTRTCPKSHELHPLRVNEKDKKGIVHGTQLGVVLPQRRKKHRHTSRVNHIATFIFKYRPITVLQADGKAPPPNHDRRAPASNSHDVLDLTVEDEDTPRQSKTLSVKREVKQERSVMFYGDIIDLTQEE